MTDRSISPDSISGKPRRKAIRFDATLGTLRTLKGGTLTVTLTTAPGELNKIMELVTACLTGNSLALSARIVPTPKVKDATKKPSPKKQRRTQRYPYRD